MAGITHNLPAYPLQYRGHFDADKVYKTVYSWMQAQQMKIFENTHKNKVAGPGVVEMEIKVKGIAKLDEYQQFTCEVYMRWYDMQQVSVVVEGQQQQWWQGRVQINVGGNIVIDYQDAFGRLPFFKRMGVLLSRILQKDTVAIKRDPSRLKLMELQNIIKGNLGIETQER